MSYIFSRDDIGIIMKWISDNMTDQQIQGYINELGFDVDATEVIKLAHKVRSYERGNVPLEEIFAEFDRLNIKR